MKKFNIIREVVNKDDPLIVEIGGHYGEDTLRFLKVFGGPSIFCFEADPRNFAILEKYVQDDHIELFEYAVSNVDNKMVDFYQSYIPLTTKEVPKKYDWIDVKDYFEMNLNSSGASSLKKGYPGANNVVKVKTIRLDTWAKERDIDEIDFLWIDVQGAEKEVIEGFKNIADRIKYIWIEYGENQYKGYLTRKQTKKILFKMGFIVNEKYSCSGNKGDLFLERII